MCCSTGRVWLGCDSVGKLQLSHLDDSAQNLAVSTQASRPRVADGAGPMGKSLSGENSSEIGPRVWRGIVYEVDVNISKFQIGKFSLDFSEVSSSPGNKSTPKLSIKIYIYIT